MPGQTDNVNLLNAANQIIVALNEISEKIDGLPGNGDLLEAIGDNIDLHRVATETGIASIVAAIGDNGAETQAVLATINNTIGSGLTSIDDTIGDRLAATNSNLVTIHDAMAACCTETQQNLSLLIEAIRNIRLQPGSGGNGDTGGPYQDEPVIDTSDPEYTPPTDPYKCKAANYVFDYMWHFLGVIAGMNTLRANTSQGAAATISAIFIGGAQLIGVVELAGLPATVVLGVVAALHQLLVTSINWSIFIYFQDLQNELTDNREELICQLYQAAISDSPQAAKDALNNFLSDVLDGVITIDHGLNLSLPAIQLLDFTLRQIVSLLAGNFLINKLFDVSPVVEVYEGELYDIGPMVSCDDCEEPGDTGVYDFTVSQYNWQLNQALCLPVNQAAWTGGQGFQVGSGDTSTTARVTIDQQVTHTINNIRVTFSSNGFILPTIAIYAADTLGGQYIQIGPTISGSQAGYQIIEITGLNIIDKYVRVEVSQFQNYPYVTIHRVEYFEN